MSQTSDQIAIQKALDTYDAFETTPTSIITFASAGRVLVLGREKAIQKARQFNNTDQLSYVFMPLNNSTEVDITGYLGKFIVTVKSPDEALQRYESDLILDINKQPIIDLAMPPAGYIHSVLKDGKIAEIESELRDMVGEFEKPKYFNYYPELCAHGVNGKTVCTRCLDACPAGAISSLVEQIEVDSNLCQGGGVCSTTCPSGAIEYIYPNLTDSGNRIRSMLQTFQKLGGDQAIVVFHALEGLPEQYSTGVLPVRVEEVASVGMDLCLSTLVYGADQIILLIDDDVPETAHQVLQQQVEIIQQLLAGLGLPKEYIRINGLGDKLQPLSHYNTLKVAQYSMPRQKRDAVFRAIDHIYQQQDRKREMVSLPAGAAYGQAIVDAERCTLCLSCVSACPGKALQDGSNKELPELSFIESRCIQCGTCTSTCPEDAISISPRFVFNREKRDRTQLLHQDQPFGCISCGKPFATQSVIHKMTTALKQHYMFQTPRGMDRLKMCEDCRVADIVQDPDAMMGQFDQQKPISK